jgi:hypothetical protein
LRCSLAMFCSRRCLLLARFAASPSGGECQNCEYKAQRIFGQFSDVRWTRSESTSKQCRVRTTFEGLFVADLLVGVNEALLSRQALR